MYALNTVTQNNSIKGIIRTKSSVHNLMQICTSIPLYKKKKNLNSEGPTFPPKKTDLKFPTLFVLNAYKVLLKFLWWYKRSCAYKLF